VAARARRLTLTRRVFLAASGAAALLTACDDEPARPSTQGSGRKRYGDTHGSQFADLRMPKGDPLATVVLLHGGFWLADCGLDEMDALVEAFTDLGFATWNVEYRRIGRGGGYPNTLTDVADAIDRLTGKDLPDGLAHNVVLVGHSAGGHLAGWAASRSAKTPGGEPKVRPRGAISLGGLLDLTGAGNDSRTAQGVSAFMGGGPAAVPASYALADPSLLVPAPCPVWAVAAREDVTVPPEQSITYVARAKAAGGGRRTGRGPRRPLHPHPPDLPGLSHHPEAGHGRLDLIHAGARLVSPSRCG